MARTRRFADSFWESDFNGTLGFDHLCKRLRDGQKTCKDIEDFLKKRAKAELQYSKSLQHLIKPSDIRDEPGSGLRASWQALRKHTETLAQIHENAHTEYNKLADNISRFAEKQKVTAKQLEDKVKEDQKHKKNAYNKVVDAQRAYHSKCRELINQQEQYNTSNQGVIANPKDLEKLKTRVEKSKEAMEQADIAYKQSVDLLERIRSTWEQNMVDSCEEIQQLEEERIWFLRNDMWKCTNVDSRCSVICDDSSEEVRQKLEDCDIARDIHEFIDHHMTGSARPVPILYEGYFTDNARPNIGSSPKPSRRPPPPNHALPPVPGADADYSTIDNSSLYSFAKEFTTTYKVTRNYIPDGVHEFFIVRRGDLVEMLEPENNNGMTKVKHCSTGRVGMVPSSHLQQHT